MARFAVNNLGDHECLVLETLTKKQSLFVWRADLTTPETLGLSAPSESKTLASDETPEESPEAVRPEDTHASSGRTRFSGGGTDFSSAQTLPGPDTQRSESVV